MEDNAFMKVGEEVYRDFVPLWFKKIGATKPLVFRAIISGLTETSTPSWSGNKFIGNPYSFYTYSGVERSVSFNIKLMASSPIELNVIWERLKVLTSYTYPTIYKGLSNPPIIEFRLGSMYVDRVAYVDSLTYTIPDESNWETDGNIGYLPKTIDVALSMKFIESGGAEDRLYDMDISKAAAKTINDARKDEVDAINEEAKTRGGKAVAVPQKVTEKKQSSVTVLKGKGSSAFGKAKDVLKSLKGKADDVTTTPADKEASIPDPKAGQSAIVEKLDGKTPIEAIKENQSNGMSPKLAKSVANLLSMGYVECSRDDVPANQVQFISEKYGPSKFFKKTERNGSWEIQQAVSNFSLTIRVAGGRF